MNNSSAFRIKETFKPYITYYALTNYYPENKFPHLPIEADKDRQRIYKFKEGHYTQAAAGQIVNAIKATLNPSLLNATTTVTCIIPAATTARTNKRFEKYIEHINRQLHLQNGYDYIQRKEADTPIHGWIKAKATSPLQSLIFQEKHIHDKNILLFDDITTTGRSFLQISEKLRTVGAKTVTGIFIARTYTTEKYGPPYWERPQKSIPHKSLHDTKK